VARMTKIAFVAFVPSCAAEVFVTSAVRRIIERSGQAQSFWELEVGNWALSL
jgi:hypothetical protein